MTPDELEERLNAIEDRLNAIEEALTNPRDRAKGLKPWERKRNGESKVHQPREVIVEAVRLYDYWVNLAIENGFLLERPERVDTNGVMFVRKKLGRQLFNLPVEADAIANWVRGANKVGNRHIATAKKKCGVLWLHIDTQLCDYGPEI